MSQEMSRLLTAYTSALFKSVSDEYNDHATEQGVKRRYDASEEARRNLISAIEALEQKAKA